MLPRFASVALVATFSFLETAVAVELTEIQGGAHAYPAWIDPNGKKLANGEFKQWIEDERLHIVITYRFSDGQVYEEKALFRQDPELI